MKQANDPNTDYKALVRQGYDLCAAVYEKARWAETNPELTLLTSRLSYGATVLDVGCGAGVPIARALAERFIVTGVDISCEMISRAHVNVPEGRFILRDIMSVEFPPSCFDAAVAFYSIFHLPREEHPCLFQRIHGWLKPGGYLLATVSQFSEAPYTEDDFHGVTITRRPCRRSGLLFLRQRSSATAIERQAVCLKSVILSSSPGRAEQKMRYIICDTATKRLDNSKCLQ